MKKYDIIIIGGGASGLMCALQIKNKSVLIIEKQEKIGKKILATGNGRCNLTNETISTCNYNNELVKPYFDNFSNMETLKYFDLIGLSYYKDEEGRYYPVSNYSASMLDVLRLSLDKHTNIEILTNCTATNVDYINNEYIVSSTISNYKCSNLVIAVGGNFNNIFNFHIDYVPFTPALCGFKTEKNKGLNGIRQKNVKVTLINNDTYYQYGEILFKEFGISGICVFNLSLHYNPTTKNELSLDLLPLITLNDLIKLIKNKSNIFEKCENLFTSLFQKQLSLSILEKANIEPNRLSSSLSDNEITTLSSIIKNYKINITGLENNNQIYKGGIDLQLLTDHLEYKNSPNLYFLGEACDVNGECGGYNLQWAWTSGKICGEYLDKK